MDWGRIGRWAALLFVLFLVIKQPEHAAQISKSIGGALMSAADAIGTFFTKLTS